MNRGFPIEMLDSNTQGLFLLPADEFKLRAVLDCARALSRISQMQRMINVPAIVLAMRSTQRAQVTALDAGANCYIVGSIGGIAGTDQRAAGSVLVTRCSLCFSCALMMRVANLTSQTSPE